MANKDNLENECPEELMRQLREALKAADPEVRRDMVGACGSANAWLENQEDTLKAGDEEIVIDDIRYLRRHKTH